MLLIHMLRLGWWWLLCIARWLSFSSLWILCPLFLLVFSGWQPLFWFLGLSGVLQGCLLCCIFFLGICIWVPLRVSCCLAWFCFLGLALFSLPCILLFQILYGTFLRRGLWYPTFPVELLGRGGWGTRHPSTVGCSVGFLVLFVGLYCSFLVLWLFRQLGLRILLPIGLLLVWCCPWFLFLLLVRVWCGFWLSGLSSVSWSMSGFFLWLRSYAVHVVFRPAMLCRRLFERPRRLCMLFSYHFWFLRWFGLGL